MGYQESENPEVRGRPTGRPHGCCSTARLTQTPATAIPAAGLHSIFHPNLARPRVGASWVRGMLSHHRLTRLRVALGARRISRALTTQTLGSRGWLVPQPSSTRVEASVRHAAARNFTPQRRFFSDDILIAVPSMGDSITEGDMGVIHFGVGDVVNADDVLAEIETDKTMSEVKAPVSGTITAVLIEEGDTVIVNQELFKLAAGEGAPRAASTAEPAAAAAATPAPSPAPTPSPAPAPSPAPSGSRKPMIMFRYGCNKGQTSAFAGDSYTVTADYANYTDPSPAEVRLLRGVSFHLSEEEMEGILVSCTSVCRAGWVGSRAALKLFSDSVFS